MGGEKMNPLARERFKSIDQIRKWIKDDSKLDLLDPVQRADFIRKIQLVQGVTAKKAEEYIALVLGE